MRCLCSPFHFYFLFLVFLFSSFSFILGFFLSSVSSLFHWDFFFSSYDSSCINILTKLSLLCHCSNVVGNSFEYNAVYFCCYLLLDFYFFGNVLPLFQRINKLFKNLEWNVSLTVISLAVCVCVFVIDRERVSKIELKTWRRKKYGCCCIVLYYGILKKKTIYIFLLFLCICARCHAV